jgi:hypothetical protein
MVLDVGYQLEGRIWKNCMVTHERGRERVREIIFPKSADTIKKYDRCDGGSK